MEVTVLIVLIIVMDQIVNVAKKITTCEMMAIAFTVVVTQLVLGHFNVIQKASVNVNQASTEKSVTDVKLIITALVLMAVNHVTAILEVQKTT